MKISVLEIIGDPSLAGAPRHVLSIIESLDLEKFEIHVICPPGPLAGEIRDLRRHIDLDLISMPSRFNLKAIRQIRKSMKQVKPDVIHIHGTRAGALGRLASIGLGIPVIYTEHLWTKQFHLKNRTLTPLHLLGNWFLDIFTTLNIAVSEAVKQFMIDNKISREEKIVVIYNGVEPPKVQVKIFQTKKEILIGTVGTLNEQKGIQFLIRALSKIKIEFPEVRLEIIGDGPTKKALEKEVKLLKLKNYVFFHGFVPDVEKLLLKMDLYVQPSLSESFGLAILQAMSLGLPVVATNTGGIPEIVTDGKSGILVEPGDPLALSNAILQLLRNPEDAKKMGKMAEKEAKLKFLQNDMINSLESIYEAIVKDPAFSL